MLRLRKSLYFFIGAIMVILLVLVFFVSHITKYLVQKYDEEYTGRQVTMDWAFVNPLTGYVHFRNLKVYEQNSDSVFLSTKGLSINFALHKLFFLTYEIYIKPTSTLS